jgi:lysine 2,3-aminomutase
MEAIEYIKRTPQVRDVLLSGGDPLLLPDELIEKYLKALREIPHVEIIRIGTRVPATLPQRITPKLCRMLKKYHPLYINTHFEHPNELTKKSAKACAMLANAGIQLGNQSVVLKGVNDDPEIMKALFQGLLKIRVKPYYLYQCDPVRGLKHFRTEIEKGLDIIKHVRGYTTGMAVPQYVVDTPGGKVPLLPHYLVKKDGHKYIFKSTFEDKECEYVEGE